MAVRNGPTKNDTFIFPDDLATQSVLEPDFPAGSKKSERNGPYTNTYFELPFKTPEDKKAVNDAVNTWKDKFDAFYPMSFRGEDAKQRAFFDKMKAGWQFGPDGSVARTFIDRRTDAANGVPPAQERYAAARETLDGPPHTQDPNATYARSELMQLGAAQIDRGGRPAWVLAPGPTLERTEWDERIETAKGIVREARQLDKDPKANLLMAQAAIIIDKGYGEEAFGFAITTTEDLDNDYGRWEVVQAVRKGQEAYATAYAEFEEVNNDTESSAKLVAEKQARLVMEDGGTFPRPFRRLEDAANAQLGKERKVATMADIVAQDVQQRIEERDPSRVKQSTGAYVVDEQIKNLAKAIKSGDDNLSETIQNVARIQQTMEEISDRSVNLIPVPADKPFVSVGPFEASSQNFAVQDHQGLKQGVETFEYVVHERDLFLTEQFTQKRADAARAYAESHADNKYAQADAARLQAGLEGSVSVGHMIADRTRNATLEKAIETEAPIAIGKHAGVLVAMSMIKVKEAALDKNDRAEIARDAALAEDSGVVFDAAAETRRRAERDWAQKSPAEQQDFLLKQVVREVEFAGMQAVREAQKRHREAQGLRTVAKLKDDAGIEDVAEFEVNRDAVVAFNAKRSEEIAAERNGVVAAAVARIEPRRAEAIAEAKAAHAEKPLADARSLPVANDAPARIPAPVAERGMVEEREPAFGRFAAVEGHLFVLQEMRQIKQAGKDPINEPTGAALLFNAKNSNDLLKTEVDNRGTSRIAKHYLESGAETTVGFSNAALVVIPGRFPWDQVKIDQQVVKNAETTKAKLAEKRSQAADKKTLGERFDPKNHQVIGQSESSQRQKMTDIQNEVKRMVAAELGIDTTKILIEAQRQNPKFTEGQAFNEAGIYVERSELKSKKREHVDRDDAEFKYADPGWTSKAVIDFDRVKWVMADVKMIKDDVIGVAAKGEDRKTWTVYALERLANEPMRVKHSEAVNGASEERIVKVGDTIEFAPTGRGENDVAEYRMEIIDDRLEKGKIEEIVRQRLIDAFGADTREIVQKLAKTASAALREQGYAQKSVTILKNDLDGRYSGVVVPFTAPVAGKAKKFVAMIENDATYQKQGGELKIRAIMDDYAHGMVADPNAKGETHVGSVGDVKFRGGKVAKFEVTRQDDIKLGKVAQEQIEKDISAQNNGTAVEQGDERQVEAGRSGGR